MAITLKAARINAGLTQNEVEEKLGVSRRTVSKWENTKDAIRPVYVYALSSLYNVSVDDIILP